MGMIIQTIYSLALKIENYITFVKGIAHSPHSQQKRLPLLFF